MGKFIQIIVVLGLMFALGLSAYRVWGISAEYLRYNRTSEDIRNYAAGSVEIVPISASDPPAAILTAPHSDNERVSDVQIVDVDMPQLKIPVNLFLLDLQSDVNTDIVGWLSLPGADIDYPILQTLDNEFYLNRDINRTESSAGSIFMDYRCDSELAYYNTVIYGHNMKNRTMFGNLRLYADSGFFDENKTGTLFTVCGTYTLNIFAYLIVSSDDAAIYSNMPATDDYFDYIRENARNYCEPVNPERIITLSTCSYEYDGARIVVLAYI